MDWHWINIDFSYICIARLTCLHMKWQVTLKATWQSAIPPKNLSDWHFTMIFTNKKRTFLFRLLNVFPVLLRVGPLDRRVAEPGWIESDPDPDLNPALQNNPDPESSHFNLSLITIINIIEILSLNTNFGQYTLKGSFDFRRYFNSGYSDQIRIQHNSTSV